MSRPRLVHIDDSEGFRLGLPHLLGDAAQVVASHATVEAFLARVCLYDVIVLDLELAAVALGTGEIGGPATGTAALRELLAAEHGPVLVCTGELADIALASVVQAGATGVINKSDNRAAFLDAIANVAAGNRYFSPALAGARRAFEQGRHVGTLTHVQAMALQLEQAGLTAERSAAQLHLAPKGARQQISARLKQARDKLGANTTAEAMERSRLGRLVRHSDVPDNPRRPPPGPDNKA
jgi:DNA-binding NarL/FixJ family response regulator